VAAKAEAEGRKRREEDAVRARVAAEKQAALLAKSVADARKQEEAKAGPYSDYFSSSTFELNSYCQTLFRIDTPAHCTMAHLKAAY